MKKTITQVKREITKYKAELGSGKFKRSHPEDLELLKLELEGYNLLDELIAWINESEAASSLTLINYFSRILNFLRFILQQEQGQELKFYAEKFLEEIKGRYKGTTYNHYIACINSFFDFLELETTSRRGRSKVVKFKSSKIDNKKFVSSHEILMVEDIFLIEKMARDKEDYRAIALFNFLLVTGARISEAAGLNIEDFERVDGRIQVKTRGKRDTVRTFTTQDKKVIASLEEYLYQTGRSWNSKGALFITDKDKQGRRNRVSPNLAFKIIQGYGEKSGLSIGKFHPHAFRACYARLLYKSGKTIEEIKRLLDHSDTKTTLIYLVDEYNESLHYESDLVVTSAKAKARLKEFFKNEDPRVHKIAELLLEDETLKNIKLGEKMGISKGQYSKKYAEVTNEMRKVLGIEIRKRGKR